MTRKNKANSAIRSDYKSLLRTLHAAWIPSRPQATSGRLFIWAESHHYEIPSDDTEGIHGSSHLNEQRNGKIPSHPAQMPVGPLRQMVRQFSTAEELNSQPATANVWLPSQNGFPLTRIGSFQKGVNVLSGASGFAILQEWQVTGLTLEPFHALAFLSRCVGATAASQNVMTNQGRIDPSSPTSLLRHVRLGNDLLFWSHAAKFVLEVLAGQHFLPALIPDQHGRFQARWQLSLLDPNLRERLNSLAAAMPPICRAYELKSPDQAADPSAILETFIGILVDQTIRVWVPAEPIMWDVGKDTRGARQDSETSAVQHWMESLLGDQTHCVAARSSAPSYLQLPPQPAHQLYQHWISWIEQLHISAADSNFRLAFALEPDLDTQPEDGRLKEQAPNWHLYYFLQDADDPNLLIPAQQVWNENGQSIRFKGRRFEQPQERLLTGLGIASRLFPPIRDSLHTPRPEMAILSTEDAYQFLKEIGPLLESSGFGVITPHWWTARSRSRLGLRLRLFDHHDASHPGQVRFHWQLTLGGQPLSQEEFEHLAARRSPLVRMHGEWVELDPEQVAAARQFIDRNQTAGHMNLLQAVQMAQAYVQGDVEGPAAHTLPIALASDPALLHTLPLDAMVVDGWLETALARLRGLEPIQEIYEPQGFSGKLRPYQRRGVGWLWFLRQLGLGACLADDMGLGKTIQAIALLLYARHQERDEGTKHVSSRPALLICPTSVVANWRHEIERFAPTLHLLVHHGSDRLYGKRFRSALAEHDLVITSFGTARRDIEMLAEIDWGDVILDEAQNIKNPAAKQTQAVRRLAAQNRLTLTGTPVENRLAELWSIMEFLNPGYLGTRERFRQQFVLPIERYNDQATAADLRRLVQPFLLRRLKTDPAIITDLPEKNEMVVYCSLTQEQASLYNQVVEETMAQVENSESMRRRGLILSLLLKLKQVTNHPAHYLNQEEPLVGRSGKLSRLTEMLEEALSVGDRALVFTQFVQMGHLLRRHLLESLGQEVLFLHGGTPAAKREQMVRSFQEDQAARRIFILSLRAGGVGVNLTRANHVFHFDRWWNPAVENQATDRAFRIGQKRSVQVYKFVVAGTLEEHIHNLIESKQNLAEAVVNSGEEWLTDLDSDDLRQILTLREEDVEKKGEG